VADILSGFIETSNVDVIHSRAEAIESLICKAAIDDIVVLAGKGHEQYQDIAGERLIFSDFDVAERAMDRLVLGPEEVSND
jgi:UDP-N-acetylmuramoyl-L-alanyl-D-glutamate--2,6-diaminopimelate ligase